MTKSSGKRILVVEDEPLVAMLAEDMLLELGYAVVGPASNLGDALDLASRAKFDAAVLDVNLNGKRSDAVAGLLRSKGIPFVIATGYGTSGDPCGEEPIVYKPYGAEQLAAALDKLF